MAAKKKTAEVEAELAAHGPVTFGPSVAAKRSFQFRHVSGLVVVDAGDVLESDHPAVRHRPDWFAPAIAGNTPDGEE